MNEQDFVQLMCEHKLRREDRDCLYRCRCGVIITDQDLAHLPEKYGKAFTTWMAYHFESGEK